MTTYCEDCANVTAESKKGPHYRWQCIKHPRMEGNGFVKKDIRESEPYLYCRDVNGGRCPLYQLDESKQVKLNLGE